MSRMLFDERPILVPPRAASIIGLNEAIILQQIHYWILNYKDDREWGHYHNNRWWVWNTIKEWKRNFPFWSEKTIHRTLTKLSYPIIESNHPYTPGKYPRGPLIIVGNYNKKGYDRTLWYTIDYDEVDRIENTWLEVDPCGQNDQMDVDKMTTPIP